MDSNLRLLMLTCADADVARRDPGLPGLATVFDPDGFLAALGSAAPGRDLRRAEIRYLKYRPGRYCRVTYHVDVSGATYELDVLAGRSEEIASPLAVGSEPTVAGPLGSGRLLLEPSAVLVTVFPNDPRLPQVPSLTDPDRRARMLRELLPDRPDLWEVGIQRLSYWPGRRYSAGLQGSNGSRAFIKAYTPKSYRRSLRNAGAIRSSGPLRVARLLGASEEHRLLAFEWLPGRCLSDLCLAPEFEWQPMIATGAALASLHGQYPEGLERWTREDEAVYLRHLASEIGFLSPPLSARADRLARRLAAWLADAPALQHPFHGDFSDGQVLIDGTEVAIVDLDSARCGDPADDLGALLAQVESYALRDKLPRDFVETTRLKLLEGYGRLSSGPAERIRAYTAAGLLRRARFAFRARKPDWPQIMSSSLERAEGVLDERW